MRRRDFLDIARRLDEVERVFTGGYTPACAFGEPLWIKDHDGRLFTHAGALRDIERDTGIPPMAFRRGRYAA